MLHTSLGASSPGETECRLFVFGFFFCTFEIFQTIAQAVFGGLINDVVPVEVIGRFFGLFRAVSLIAGMIFNFWLIGYAETHYFYIFLGLSALYGIGFSLMCLKVKEGDYPPPPPLEPGNPLVRSLGTARDYLRECFTNRYYLLVFLALMLGTLSGGPVNAFSVFYAKSIGLEMDAYGRLIGITFACSLALTWFLGALADRYHPLRLGILSMLLYGVVMLWAGIATDDARTFSVMLVAHGVIQGIYNTGTASIGQRLFPRLKFAQFASAAGIISAFGYMLMPPLLGKYLDLSGHVYRHTFLFSGALGLAAFGVLLLVWRGFRRLGGPDRYQAPE
jgi:MFS family permease